MNRRQLPLLGIVTALALLLAFTTDHSQAAPPPVVINEVLVGNASTNLDMTYTNYESWIELHNTTAASINLINYSLRSLQAGEVVAQTYKFPTGVSIPAGGRLLVWADKLADKNHASFELDMDGGLIDLLAPNAAVVDSVSFGPQTPDVSYGRSPDDSSAWAYFDQPTPGGANITPAFAGIDFAASPVFSVPGGIVHGPQSVQLATSEPGSTIRYTLNGAKPTTASPVYSSPIEFSSTTLIRARTFAPGKMTSPTVTYTYLVNIPVNLPVISLVTDPLNLWDNRIGIYTKGTYGLSFCGVKANWNQPWERPASIEFYEIDGTERIRQDVGFETYGSCSRKFARKSLEIKAKKRYGDNDLSYAFFNDKPMVAYRRLILRNSGQDNSKAILRDAMIQALVKNRIDLDWQAYRPAVLYLNGVYWGLYDIREKMDEDYPQSNYGLNDTQFDQLEKNKIVMAGNAAQWTSFYQYVLSNDPANPAVYSNISSRMDIDEYINYLITEMYAVNTDWPTNNTRYWKAYAPGSRWRWLLFDLDYGFYPKNVEKNMITYTTGVGGQVAKLTARLLRNPQFVAQFAQGFAVHLNTTFETGRVIGVIDSMQAAIAPEMPAHIARWGEPVSVAKWQSNVQELRSFATQRPAAMRSHLRTLVGNKPDATLTIYTVGDGRVNVAGAEVSNGYSGLQFKDVPITLTAAPGPGTSFARWQETGETSPTITLPFNAATTRTAVFEVEPLPPVVINEIHFSPSTSLHGATADDLYEFVELYNAGTSPVDLSGFSFTGFTFVFAPGSSIGPGEYIVVAKTAATYSGHGYQVYPFAGGGLSSSGEPITLKNTFGYTVDSVTYGVSAPWPASPKGGGPTLSLKDPLLDNSLASSWAPSRQDDGTPGAVNFLAPVVITEIHFNSPDSQGPDADFEFVELYNAGAEIVQLQGFNLTGIDLVFPLGARIDPSEYIVLARNPTSYGGAYQSFGWAGGELDDTGETLTLRDGAGHIIDTVAYGNAAPWPVAPDGTGPSLALLEPDLDNSLPTSWAAAQQTGGTPGLPNFPPLIVINEIHYNPADGQGADADYEFVELYNAAPAAVDLSGFTFSGVDLTLPGGASIGAGEYVVLARNPANYGGPYQAFGWAGGELDDAGETLSLLDADGYVVDSVTYNNTSPWPVEPSGNGPSLSLGLTSLDNSLVANWAASDSDGGTPGAANFPPLPLVITELHYSVNATLQSGGDNTWEFFEVYNRGAKAYDLSGYTTDGVVFTFPPGSSIGAGQDIVVANTAATYAGLGCTVFDWSSGGLSSSGELVALKNRFGTAMTSLTFGTAAPWPVEPKGTGPTLALLDVALDNTVPANWAASAQVGGTPCAVNFPPGP